jgi:hypothetical protein
LDIPGVPSDYDAFVAQLDEIEDLEPPATPAATVNGTKPETAPAAVEEQPDPTPATP